MPRLLPLTLPVLLLAACAGTPRPSASPLEPVAPRPDLAMGGIGPVLGISLGAAACPGAPQTMLFYPFSEAERKALEESARCLKANPGQRVVLRGHGAGDAARQAAAAALQGAGASAAQIVPSFGAATAGDKPAVELYYPPVAQP
ncbi:hypothetical protein [Crenobacter intestini]|uniref:OmpA-like domain-containing protein n=1 Tax=Crenobacter intestini TaxID=2563443 RepID=A0A4T0V3S4_9NEIS|nr:hypothetical protein [Crenobacter intestini]TIC86179.1 hypothetical protein E5K04_03490 [Crenobacter intestini]